MCFILLNFQNYLLLTSKIYYYEIAISKVAYQPGLSIESKSWLFHVAIEKQINYTHEITIRLGICTNRE